MIETHTCILRLNFNLCCLVWPSVEHHGDESHVAMATVLTQLVVHNTAQHCTKVGWVTRDQLPVCVCVCVCV